MAGPFLSTQIKDHPAWLTNFETTSTHISDPGTAIFDPDRHICSALLDHLSSSTSLHCSSLCQPFVKCGSFVIPELVQPIHFVSGLLDTGAQGNNLCLSQGIQSMASCLLWNAILNFHVRDYTAHTVAVVLYKYYYTFGTFDIIYSDPGSSLMSIVLSDRNRWLGIPHEVSVVSRHESNETEHVNTLLLGHLRRLVHD